MGLKKRFGELLKSINEALEVLELPEVKGYEKLKEDLRTLKDKTERELRRLK